MVSLIERYGKKARAASQGNEAFAEAIEGVVTRGRERRDQEDLPETVGEGSTLHQNQTDFELSLQDLAKLQQQLAWNGLHHLAAEMSVLAYKVKTEELSLALADDSIRNTLEEKDPTIALRGGMVEAFLSQTQLVDTTKGELSLLIKLAEIAKPIVSQCHSMVDLHTFLLRPEDDVHPAIEQSWNNALISVMFGGISTIEQIGSADAISRASLTRNLQYMTNVEILQGAFAKPQQPPGGK